VCESIKLDNLSLHRKKCAAHHLEFKLYEPQQYTLLLPATHCASLDARPHPKSAPEETAVNDAFDGMEMRGPVAAIVRPVAAGMELGRSRAGGKISRVMADGAESMGEVALNCGNERGHNLVALGQTEMLAGSNEALWVEKLIECEPGGMGGV
jgi:hypothetical protein